MLYILQCQQREEIKNIFLDRQRIQNQSILHCYIEHYYYHKVYSRVSYILFSNAIEVFIDCPTLEWNFGGQNDSIISIVEGRSDHPHGQTLEEVVVLLSMIRVIYLMIRIFRHFSHNLCMISSHIMADINNNDWHNNILWVDSRWGDHKWGDNI